MMPGRPEPPNKLPDTNVVDADDLTSAEFELDITQVTQERKLSDETAKAVQAKEKARRMLEDFESSDDDEPDDTQDSSE